MPVCMVLVEFVIACVHDYMVVTVTVTKIYGKMNFDFRNYSYTSNSHTTISDNWLRTSAVIHMYKERVQDVYSSLHTVINDCAYGSIVLIILDVSCELFFMYIHVCCVCY